MTKYHNKKTMMDGIVFDSAREARRYQELKLLERAGEIKDLALQVSFEVLPGSDKHRPVKYIADFVYWEKTPGGGWEFIVEDAKGVLTGMYRLKKKLLYARYGYWIRET